MSIRHWPDAGGNITAVITALNSVRILKINYKTVKHRTFCTVFFITQPGGTVSFDAFAEDIIEAKKAGMNSHLAKPLNLATLVREINKQLQKHKKIE